MTSEDVANHSVARKLLRELTSDTISGHGILRHLHAGSLMGCLTHLSLAGCTSIHDDAAWGHRPLLTSQFASLFLANPHLQYIDISRTGLSNNGIFFVLLEMSLCDPLLSPSGLKSLKQVVVGPPAGGNEQARGLEGNGATYVSSITEALAELYFQSPMLQCVALLLPAVMQCVPTYREAQSDRMLKDAWCQLDEDNATDETTLEPKLLQPCLMLRTRRGKGVSLETHEQMMVFSQERMVDDWITCDKTKMNSALDGDRVATFATGFEMADVVDKVPARKLQVGDLNVEAERAQSSRMQRQERHQSQIKVHTLTESGQGERDPLLQIRGSACISSRDKQQPILHSLTAPFLEQSQGHAPHEERGKQRERRQRAKLNSKTRPRHYTTSGRQAGTKLRRHAPRPQPLPGGKVYKARVVHTTKRSKSKGLHAAHVKDRGASRTVDALLDNFAYSAHSLKEQDVSCSTRARESECIQAGADQVTDVVDLFAPVQAWRVSPAQGRCHSDPGPSILQPRGARDEDFSDFDDKDDFSGDVGVVQSAQNQSRTAFSGEPMHTYNVANADDRSTPHRRRPRRCLLPLWDSPSPRLSTPRAATATKVESPEHPVIDVCSDDQTPSPPAPASMSPQGLSSDHADRSLCAQQRPCTSTSIASEPTDSNLNSDETPPSQLLIPRNVNRSVHGPNDLEKEEAHQEDAEPIRVQKLQWCISNDDGQVEMEKPNSPDEGFQPRLTGAQRRRLRRQQEFESMQKTDPQGWTRLQEAMQAMMPYGWDKRKEQHPIGAALDPTTFDTDEGKFYQSNPAAFCLESTNEVLQSLRVHESLAAQGVRRAARQLDDLDSDDDFDPTFTTVQPQIQRVDEQDLSSGPVTTNPPSMPDARSLRNGAKASVAQDAAERQQASAALQGEVNLDVAWQRTSLPLYTQNTSQQEAATLAEAARLGGPPPPLHQQPSFSADAALLGPSSQGATTPVTPAVPEAFPSSDTKSENVRVAASRRFSTTAILLAQNTVPKTITAGQMTGGHESHQLDKDDHDHATIKQTSTQLDQGSELCSYEIAEPNSGGLCPAPTSAEDGAGDLRCHDLPQPAPPSSGRQVFRTTHLEQTMPDQQAGATTMYQHGHPQLPISCTRPYAKAVDRHHTPSRLGTAVKTHSMPEKNPLTHICPALSDVKHDGELGIAHPGPPSCAARQKKTRAQRELDRLSVFSWDKRKADNPVGKQLSFFQQQPRPYHQRTPYQACASGLQVEVVPKLPTEPPAKSMSMPATANPGDSTELPHPTSPRIAHCARGPDANHTGARETCCIGPDCAEDFSLTSKVDSYSDNVAGTAVDVLDQASIVQTAAKKRSRLSRLPRPLHRAKPKTTLSNCSTIQTK